MTKKALYVCGVAAAVLSFGCSGGGGGGSGDSGVRTQSFTDSYRYIDNGCDTGKHEFSGSSSQDVTNQICKALQDRTVNKDCAEGMRESYFEKRCPGMTWVPFTSDPVITPSNPDSNSSHNNSNNNGTNPNSTPQPTNYISAYLAEDQLEKNFVDSATLTPGLSNPVKADISLLAGELSQCGFTTFGICSDKVYTNNIAVLGYSADAKASTLYIRFSGNNVSDFVGKFTFPDVPRITLTTAEIFTSPTPLNTVSSMGYLSLPLSKVATLKVSTDFSVVMNNLKAASDLRALYRLMMLAYSNIDLELQQNSMNLKEGYANIADAVFAKESLILQSNQSHLQRVVLSTLKDLAIHGGEEKKFISLAEKLMSSTTDSDVRDEAASDILLLDKSRQDLKPIVLNALQNSKNASIRYEAVEAYGKAATSASEEISIILAVADSDYNVSTEAYDIAKLYNLTDVHLDAIKTVLKSTSTSVRYNGVALLGKIKTDAATNVLVLAILDKDYNTSAEAHDLLVTRPALLSDLDLDALSTVIAKGDLSQRYNAIEITGLIKTPNSTKVLIKSLGDSEYNVAQEAYDLLSHRTLTDDNLDDLAVQLKNKSLSVRYNVVALISKVSGLRSNNMLIGVLLDSEYNVAQEAFDTLSSRSLSEESLASLTTVYASPNLGVRYNAVSLIAKISGMAATNSLIDALVDKEYNVSNLAFDSLNARKLTAEVVDHLASLFKNSQSSVRYNVAVVLGNIKDKKSLQALQAQLTVEKDYNVKEAIVESIQKIGNI